MSSTFANDTKSHAGTVKRKSVSFTKALTLSFTLATAALLMVPAHAEAPKAKKAASTVAAKGDPFTGDVWHAINGTWPGTLVFDGKSKKVVLTPVGAQAIQATYEVLQVEKKGEETQGSLRMKSATDGQQVEATFTMKDRKNLSMRYKNGQRDETYVRMTPAEEEAEKARLLKLLEEKKFGTLLQNK